jgi:hypothetical protein
VNNKRTTTEQQVNTNKKNKNIKNDKNVINYSDIPALNDAILGFVEYRKGIKNPMTEHAVKLMVAKLYKMTSDVNEQIEILNQSIVNGWKGIFPLKKESGQPVKKGPVPKWMQENQRQYDYDALERELLANGSTNTEWQVEAEALKRELQEKY